MLFNSPEFLLFLPIVFGLYWFVTQRNLKAQNPLLISAYALISWLGNSSSDWIVLYSILDLPVRTHIEGTPAKREKN